MIGPLSAIDLVRCATRNPNFSTSFPSQVVLLNSPIAGFTNWTEALKGVRVVIHCAGIAHVTESSSQLVLSDYRKVNTQDTLRLASQAAAQGVRRFIFLSSIKVNGEFTDLGKPFTPFDVPMTLDPYGISKLEAEQGLFRIAEETGMEVVIIRPPLVYGSGVKANFLSMVKILCNSVPLPLGCINNLRSLVALDNLVDLISKCVTHPAAANQIFLVSDGEDLSTVELLRRMAYALEKPARFFPVPISCLKFLASIFGKRKLLQNACSSLQVDISKTRELLGWYPVVSVDEGLRQVASSFLIKK